MREAAWTLGVLRDLGSELVELRAALEREVAATAERVFDLLAFIHERLAVQRVAAHIARGPKEKRAYAHEVLDLVLDPRTRELVAPLVEDVASTERLRRLSARYPQSCSTAMRSFAR